MHAIRSASDYRFLMVYMIDADVAAAKQEQVKSASRRIARKDKSERVSSAKIWFQKKTLVAYILLILVMVVVLDVANTRRLRSLLCNSVLNQFYRRCK